MADSRDSNPPTLPDFVPVPRRNTVTHGWTAAKQRAFIEGLAATGSVRMAAEAVGMGQCGVYKLRHAPGGESFARAWDAAVALGAARIRDVLFDQAIHGIPEVVVLGKDVRIERRRFNHRTMIWALQHHMPDQYPGGSTLKRAAAVEPFTPTPEQLAEAQRRVLARFDAHYAAHPPPDAPEAGAADAADAAQADPGDAD